MNPDDTGYFSLPRGESAQEQKQKYVLVVGPEFGVTTTREGGEVLYKTPIPGIGGLIGGTPTNQQAGGPVRFVLTPGSGTRVTFRGDGVHVSEASQDSSQGGIIRKYVPSERQVPRQIYSVSQPPLHSPNPYPATRPVKVCYTVPQGDFVRYIQPEKPYVQSLPGQLNYRNEGESYVPQVSQLHKINYSIPRNVMHVTQGRVPVFPPHGGLFRIGTSDGQGNIQRGDNMSTNIIPQQVSRVDSPVSVVYHQASQINSPVKEVYSQSNQADYQLFKPSSSGRNIPIHVVESSYKNTAPLKPVLARKVLITSHQPTGSFDGSISTPSSPDNKCPPEMVNKHSGVMFGGPAMKKYSWSDSPFGQGKTTPASEDVVHTEEVHDLGNGIKCRVRRQISRQGSSGSLPDPSQSSIPVSQSSKDKNIFSRFRFHIGSIGDFGPSGSGPSTPVQSLQESGPGIPDVSRNQAHKVLFVRDFDDFVNRVAELKNRTTSNSTPSSAPPPNVASKNLQERECSHPDCQYTCHHKCRQLVTLDCTSISSDGKNGEKFSRKQSETSLSGDSSQTDDAESGYHTADSSLQAVHPPGERTLTREDLRKQIDAFNQNNHGLVMTIKEGVDTFQGFVRVYMNLMRPISMSLSPRPTSIYDVIGEESLSSDNEDTMTTSFYLPKDTTKVIHITSETTAQEVIKALLHKFKITDNPRKFALYEKIQEPGSKVKKRRLVEDEKPLCLCLSWTVEGLETHKIILQENDTGEVMWEAFSIPELENFLRILDREEEEYLEQVRAKYQLLKIQMTQRMKEVEKEQSFVNDTRQPVFV